jgi:hypothetical protein
MSYDGEMRDAKQKRKPSPKKSDHGGDQPQFRYINVSPTKEQKAQISIWASEYTVVLDALDMVVNQRCNLAVKYSAASDCFVCSCTNLNPVSVNYGAVATSYASQPNRAFFTTLWYVSEVWGVNEEWPRSLSFDPEW